jgi:hypothetical protein
MSDDEIVYFKLKDGVNGHYSIMSENGEDHYFFVPGEIIGVHDYDAPKLRCVPYAEEVTETGMPVPDDPSKGPAEAVIGKQDLPGGRPAGEDPDRETPEDVPEPPEEEEEIEDDPSMIDVEIENVVELVDNDGEIDFDEKDRTDLIKIASELGYYEKEDSNPAQAKSEELIKFIEEII